MSRINILTVMVWCVIALAIGAIPMTSPSITTASGDVGKPTGLSASV